MNDLQPAKHEAIMLQDWITAFEDAGGTVMRQIEKKKEIFGLLKEWHSAFDDHHNSFGDAKLPETSSVFLVSLFGDSGLPTHRWSSLTFAFELRPPAEWTADVQGLPGEFVMFDSEFRWTTIVTHEETRTLVLDAKPL